MRMLFTAAILALTVTPAVAAPAEKNSFTHEGITYVYTATTKGDVKVINGKSYPGAKPFELVVRNDRVSGTSGFAPVSFKLSEVERIKASDVKIAAR
jgi:hypothetical protein